MFLVSRRRHGLAGRASGRPAGWASPRSRVCSSAPSSSWPGWVHSQNKAGKDVGELIGSEPLGIAATNSVEEILALDAEWRHLRTGCCRIPTRWPLGCGRGGRW